MACTRARARARRRARARAGAGAAAWAAGAAAWAGEWARAWARGAAALAGRAGATRRPAARRARTHREREDEVQVERAAHPHDQQRARVELLIGAEIGISRAEIVVQPIQVLLRVRVVALGGDERGARGRAEEDARARLRLVHRALERRAPRAHTLRVAAVERRRRWHINHRLSDGCGVDRRVGDPALASVEPAGRLRPVARAVAPPRRRRRRRRPVARLIERAPAWSHCARGDGRALAPVPRRVGAAAVGRARGLGRRRHDARSLVRAVEQQPRAHRAVRRPEATASRAAAGRLGRVCAAAAADHLLARAAAMGGRHRRDIRRERRRSPTAREQHLRRDRLHQPRVGRRVAHNVERVATGVTGRPRVDARRFAASEGRAGQVLRARATEWRGWLVRAHRR